VNTSSLHSFSLSILIRLARQIIRGRDPGVCCTGIRFVGGVTKSEGCGFWRCSLYNHVVSRVGPVSLPREANLWSSNFQLSFTFAGKRHWQSVESCFHRAMWATLLDSQGRPESER
jgi:hypothetical protein